MKIQRLQKNGTQQKCYAAEATFSNLDSVVRLKLYITGYYSTVQCFEMFVGNS